MPQINTNAENETKFELKKPKLYQVLLLNDEITSMDFVVQVLIDIFHHDTTDAINLMLKIHNEGKAICGIYSYEIAATKANEVLMAAKNANYPLKAILQED